MKIIISPCFPNSSSAFDNLKCVLTVILFSHLLLFILNTNLGTFSVSQWKNWTIAKQVYDRHNIVFVLHTRKTKISQKKNAFAPTFWQHGLEKRVLNFWREKLFFGIFFLFNEFPSPSNTLWLMLISCVTSIKIKGHLKLIYRVCSFL